MTRIATVMLALTLTLTRMSPLSVCVAAAEVETDAGQLFRAGRAAYERGDFEAAGRAFEEAHRRAPRGPTIYNAARAWQAAGTTPRAANAYAEALARGDLAPEQRAHAEKTLSTLRSSLGELVWEPPYATGDGGVTIDSVEIPPGTSSWFVAPGRHEISATGTAQRSVDVRAGERRQVSLAAAPVTKAPVVETLPPMPVPPVAQPAPPALVAQYQPQPTAGLGAAGWTALGVGVVAGGGAAALGALTLEARNDFEATGYTDEDLRDRAVSLRLFTNVALGVAVAATAVVIWRYLVRDANKREPRP